MPTIAQAKETVREALVAGWALPLGFDNESFREPDDGSAYALAELRAGESRAATLGGRQVRRDQVLRVTIFSPSDAGSSACDALAQTVVNLFEVKSLSGVGGRVSFAASPSAVVRSAQHSERYWTSVIDLPFWYYETKQ